MQGIFRERVPPRSQQAVKRANYLQFPTGAVVILKESCNPKSQRPLNQQEGSMEVRAGGVSPRVAGPKHYHRVDNDFHDAHVRINGQGIQL